MEWRVVGCVVLASCSSSRAAEPADTTATAALEASARAEGGSSSGEDTSAAG